jgi:hypothetical protein
MSRREAGPHGTAATGDILTGARAGAGCVAGAAPSFVLFGALAVGVWARLRAFLADTSLWHDEAAVALNIIERSLGELAQPLSYDQAAPLGFLLAEKLVVLTFGPGEQALRLLPMLAGIASLPLTYFVARRLLGRGQALVALTLLALCAPAIVYSTEVKQYGVDLFVALVLLALAVEWDAARSKVAWACAIGLAGAAAVWLSHPSVFVLAAVGAVALADARRDHDWRRSATIAVVGSLWIASFATNYFAVTVHVAHDPDLLEFWRGRFMPFPPASFADLAWLYQKTLQLFKHPVGLKDMPGLGIALALTGVAVLARGRASLAVLFVLPVVLALAASALHKYPFEGRFLMFALPGLLFLVAEGAWYVLRRSAALTRIGPVVVVALLVAGPLLLYQQQSRWPSEQEDLRAALAGLAENWTEGDRLLVYRRSEPAYRYYQEIRPDLWDRSLPAPTATFDRVDDVLKPGSREIDEPEQRVWLVFSRVGASRYPGANSEGAVLAAMDRDGERLHEFRAAGAAVHLYEIVRPDSPLAVTGGDSGR